AAGVFGAAAALEARYPWLGYVRATAEASLVGGLADWFAVTALFRRPLGLPIPHTAIVATRKERIGRILGTFVQNHFLSRDVIAAKLRTMSLARRAAVWLSRPENSRRVAQQVAGGIAKTLEALPDDEMRPLVHDVVTARLRTLRVAFDAALRDFIDRLQHSPDAIARTEALKEDWLAEPGAAELSARLWEATRRAIVKYATQPAGGGANGAKRERPLDRGISTF